MKRSHLHKYWSWEQLMLGPFSTRGPFHEQFFHRNSNSMENYLMCKSIVGHRITTKIFTCHDGTTDVSCAKFHSDHQNTTWMRVGWIFHRIWFTMENCSWNGLLLCIYRKSDMVIIYLILSHHHACRFLVHQQVWCGLHTKFDTVFTLNFYKYITNWPLGDLNEISDR